MHHSVELDPNGTLWIPSVSQAGFADDTWLSDRIRDDALANVSTGGKILGMYSFVKILRDNGLSALLVGLSGPNLNPDPIHMNQIRVAPRDSKYWNRGDLLISARHLSAVFLYRPSTGKIIWHKIGPWLNQHAADFVGEHQISVLDNNIIAFAPKAYAFLTPAEVNRVMLYDFDTGQTSQPFANLLDKTRPVTITGGLARVLPDGGLFIEETNYGRHLRFTRDQLLWSRINDFNAQYIGTVSWSRYLTADEAKIPLQSLAMHNCAVEVTTQSALTPESAGLASNK
jgi:Arylsulfotransferase (ASST)